VGFDGTISVWDSPDDQCRRLYGHKSSIQRVIEWGENFVTADAEGNILYWNKGIATRVSGEGHKKSIFDIKKSASSKFIYSISADDTLRTINTDTWTYQAKLQLEKQPISLAVSRLDDSLLYMLLISGKLLKVRENVIESERSFAFSATQIEINEDTEELYVGDKKGGIHVYSLKDFESPERSSLAFHQNEVTSLAYSPQFKLLASADTLKNIIVWDTEQKTIKNEFYGHLAKVFTLSWAKTHQTLVSGGLDGITIVWDLASGTKRKIEGSHQSGVTSAVFIGDEKRVVTGGFDACINEWEL